MTRAAYAKRSRRRIGEHFLARHDSIAAVNFLRRSTSFELNQNLRTNEGQRVVHPECQCSAQTPCTRAPPGSRLERWRQVPSLLKVSSYLPVLPHGPRSTFRMGSRSVLEDTGCQRIYVTNTGSFGATLTCCPVLENHADDSSGGGVRACTTTDPSSPLE